MSSLRRLGVAVLMGLGLNAFFAPSAEAARGCRIRIYGETRYTGSVTNRGFSTFTRFAVTVNFELRGALIFSQTRRGPWVAGCPDERQSVSITPDRPSSDPQMMLFLQEVQGEAMAKSEGGGGDPISAAYFELSSAARNLRGSIVRTGFTEIAIDAAWDVAQLVAPFSISQQIVGSFVVELTKEWVKGGNGKDLKRWAQVNGASFLKSVGLDEKNQALVDAFIQIADRTEKVLNEKMEPIVLTATGTAGECGATSFERRRGRSCDDADDHVLDTRSRRFSSSDEFHVHVRYHDPERHRSGPAPSMDR